jgi:hypothetical protein
MCTKKEQYYFYYSADGDILVTTDKSKRSDYFMNIISTECITIDGDRYSY